MIATELSCARMEARTAPAALRLLSGFLAGDPHYLASSRVYGDGGVAAVEAAIALFLARPEIGFVWLGSSGDEAVAAAVACFAISTSRGALVVKLDDVTVAPAWQGRGVGAAFLGALVTHLRGLGVTRIDCGCHRDNRGAWRFYERLGFRPLDEERIALLI